jgi:hypothetical protein
MALFEELVETGQESYQVSQWPNENSVGVDSFILTFYTFEDEPWGSNMLFLNWGIFQNGGDTEIAKVYG